MEIFGSIVTQIDAWIWGVPMIALLIFVHIVTNWKTFFIQRKLPKAIKLSVSNDAEADGDISQFGALCTALSGTLGVGCIVGVATAIISGGPGALFWMWISGILGIATKYSETLIAIIYRQKDANGQMCGGAMYVWQNAFKRKNKQGKKITPWWAKLGAICFAVFTAIASLGTGSAVQASSITDSICYYFPQVPYWVVSLVLCAVVFAVIFGGIKAISKVCEKLIPAMTILYLLGVFIIIFININYLGAAFNIIFECAFTSKAVFGGTIGSGIVMALQFGMARGMFSNESGLGTAPIIASAAATKNPARQSLVAMTGAFWSTVVICALTGIAIISSMLANPSFVNADAGTLTLKVFEQIPYVGGPVLAISLIMFAISTIIGWSYYANRSILYLFGEKFVKPYLLVYIFAVFLGGSGFGGVAWSLADIANALMAIPNVLVVLLLINKVKIETKKYVWDDGLDKVQV